jgi:hypothetical protein
MKLRRHLQAAHVLVDALTLEDVEVGEGDGGASRVAAEREPVEEGRGAVAEGLVQLLICNHGAHGEVARGHALAARDDIGHYAVTSGREVPATKVIRCTLQWRGRQRRRAGEHVLAEAAEARDSLVAHHNDAVLRANIAHALQVPDKTLTNIQSAKDVQRTLGAGGSSRRCSATAPQTQQRCSPRPQTESFLRCGWRTTCRTL